MSKERQDSLLLLSLGSVFFVLVGTAIAHFNSLAMVDADGAVLGLYRKSHIPAGPGYQEKYYFTPGDTGFRVWQTRFGIFG